MKVFILGRTEMLYETARVLSRKHHIVGILTAPAAPEYARTEADFRTLADKLGCPYLCTKKLDPAAIDFISSCSPDIGVSCNWVTTVTTDVINLFPGGILNAHPADLPRYRGNAATNWALLMHESKLPVTIHFMVGSELDSGDIVVQEPMLLTERTTIKDVVDFTRTRIPALFDAAIAGLESGRIIPSTQSQSGKPSFRCFPRLPVHSKIDWDKSAKDIDALVRASTRPYSGAFSYMVIDGKIRRVTVWQSRVASTETHDLAVPGHIIKNDRKTGESWVYTGRGVIALSEVQYDGCEEGFQPGKVWRSIRMGFGVDVEAMLLQLQQKLDIHTK